MILSLSRCAAPSSSPQFEVLIVGNFGDVAWSKRWHADLQHFGAVGILTRQSLLHIINKHWNGMQEVINSIRTCHS